MKVLSSLILIAAGSPSALPPPVVLLWQASPPESLARFDALKGGFAGTSGAERAAGAALDDYARGCVRQATEAAQTELRAIGIEAKALPPGPYRDRDCRAAQTLYALVDPDLPWTDFQAALRQAWPVYSGYMAAVANAEQVAAAAARTEKAGRMTPASRASVLRARLIGEQVLRLGWSANGGEALTPAARRILQTLLQDATARRDHANTDWLKREVERSGWPTRGAAGTAGSEAAWLLVQHADDDPAFQARVLRLMTPLARRGEVSKQDYALLYDRVMMKVAGRQRYGTQHECRGGRLQPRPIEDPARVETLRRAMGLGTLAQNTARIARENPGLCQ